MVFRLVKLDVKDKKMAMVVASAGAWTTVDRRILRVFGCLVFAAAMAFIYGTLWVELGNLLVELPTDSNYFKPLYGLWLSSGLLLPLVTGYLIVIAIAFNLTREITLFSIVRNVMILTVIAAIVYSAISGFDNSLKGLPFSQMDNAYFTEWLAAREEQPTWATYAGFVFVVFIVVAIAIAVFLVARTLTTVSILIQLSVILIRP